VHNGESNPVPFVRESNSMRSCITISNTDILNTQSKSSRITILSFHHRKSWITASGYRLRVSKGNRAKAAGWTVDASSPVSPHTPPAGHRDG